MRSRRSTARTFCPFLPLPALLVCLLSFPALAELIEGRVVNRTLLRPVPGCPVSLILHGAETADTSHDTTDAEGRFRFDAPAPAEGTHLILSAPYAGVDYLHPVDGENGVEIAVYEITDADTAIALTSHHMIIDAGADEATQILIVRNSGNRTYITGEGHGHGLEVLLPDGVTNITDGPQGLHTHGQVLIDPRPVQPGGSQLMFVHALPPTRRLAQEVRYPTESVDILVTPPDSPIAESSLQDLGEATIPDGRSFRRFAGTTLNPGDRIVLQIGSSDALGEWASRETLTWGMGALAVAFALLAVFFRPRKKANVASQSGAGLEGRRTAMLEQIADLDDRFAHGDLSEADYKVRRDALKAEVVQLTQTLGETGA